MANEVLAEEFQSLSLHFSSDVENDNNVTLVAPNLKYGTRSRRQESEAVKNLTDILSNIKIADSVISDKILILSQENVAGLFFKESGDLVVNRKDLERLLSFNVEQLKRIFGNEDTVETFKNQLDFKIFVNIIRKYSVERLLSILDNTCPENCEEYSMEVILRRYDKDERHLIFMADDPNLVLYLNSDDIDLVGFGLYNYDINVPWVRASIIEDSDGDKSALVVFDRILAELGYYACDESPDEFESDQEFACNENDSAEGFE